MEFQELCTGLSFKSYEELTTFIQEYQDRNNCVLYRKDSRKIAAAKKRCPDKVFNEDLIYAEITFSCVHNGVHRHQGTTGQRPQQRTVLTGCNFQFIVRTDHECLRVSKVESSHNHELLREEFSSNPTNRKMSSETSPT